MAEMIESNLWKAAMLSRESVYFPRMVEAAAWYLGKPWSDHLLRTVASDTTLTTALPVAVDESVDQVLSRMAQDPEAAAAMDALIVDAVNTYRPPALPENEV